MDPFVGTGLAHAKQLALDHLQGIGLGVDQRKQQEDLIVQHAGVTLAMFQAAQGAA
jgi:hypothetical protein